MNQRLTARELQQKLDEHQAEFERRYDEGGIVPVSDRVAEQQLAGQRALNRAQRRAAAKAARRKSSD